MSPAAAKIVNPPNKIPKGTWIHNGTLRLGGNSPESRLDAEDITFE
jgi:hypothetical protein